MKVKYKVVRYFVNSYHFCFNFLSHSQQTLPGNVLYPTKDSPWQPVVTHLPLIATPTEIPKESIIANTDFTTTSVIAKR